MLQSTNAFSLSDRDFPHLQRYGAYLLAHHLEETATVSIELARQVNLPLLKVFAQLPEQEFLLLVKKGLETFFDQLQKQTALEHAMESLRQWQKDVLPNVPRSGVVTADLVLVYHVRKQLLLHFIDRYTHEPAVIIAIARELDLLFAQVEQFAFSLYVDLKEDEHKAVLLELQEKYGELATALEELRAAEEQLIETNNELEERVKARTGALTASEQLLRTITDAIPGLVTYIDRDERYRFLNKTYEEWFGISPTDVVGKKLEEVYGLRLGKMMGAAAYQGVRANIDRALKGEQLQYETVLNTKSQGPKPVLVHYVPHLEGEEVLGYYALATDISARVEAERALQESRDLFHSFADTIQSLAWMSDPAGQVSWYNQRWYDYTGTTPEEMQQLGWVHFMQPEHLSSINEWAKKAREKGEAWEITLPLRSAKGDWGWFLVRSVPIKDAAGTILRWVGTSTEITEQVSAREQLQKANEEIADLLQREKLALAEANAQRSTLYSTFMQAPSLLCIMRGRELVYELANPYYLDVFELNESPEGKRLDEVFPNPDPSVVAIHQQVLSTGEAYVGVELPVLSDWKQTGQPYTRYFNVRYAPLYEADTISGIITFGYEVTEHVHARKELEQNAIQMQDMNQELNQKYVELSRINNDLDNFIYTASHDLRSPLLNLEGLLLALNKHMAGSIPPKAATVLALAGVSIEKLKRTIKDLTEITKAQKGLGDVRELLSFKEVLEDIKSDLPEDTTSLATYIKEDFQVASVLYSRAGLRTILYNLLSNAIKYKSEDRPLKIRISTQEENSYTLLRVEDNGLGIAEQQLPKLFTMFTRLHTHVEGTGIGLYTIKRVIENSGGKIAVSSTLDKGSVFSIYLPA